MRDIRVATVQFEHAPGDKAYNLARVRHFASQAEHVGAEIVAFPEMCGCSKTCSLRCSAQRPSGMANM